jgi:cobalt/nickel transport system permease protein
LHHAVLDEWSRRGSFLHRRDARVKTAILALFLIALATLPLRSVAAPLILFALAAAGIFAAKLPAGGVLLRAAAVLPFTAVFSIISAAAGDTPRALALLERTFTSALAVLVIAGSTPFPDLMQALAWFRLPAFLLLVTQFLYRYLFVISEQAQHVRLAASSRAGISRAPRSRRLKAAAGAVAVLFVRSHERAQGIHQAMLARGFSGAFRASCFGRVSAMDAVFGAAVAIVLVSVRLQAGR